MKQKFAHGDKVLVKDGFHKELQPGKIKELIKKSVIGIRYVVIENSGFKVIVSANSLMPVTGRKE